MGLGLPPWCPPAPAPAALAPDRVRRLRMPRGWGAWFSCSCWGQRPYGQVCVSCGVNGLTFKLAYPRRGKCLRCHALLHWRCCVPKHCVQSPGWWVHAAARCTDASVNGGTCVNVQMGQAWWLQTLLRLFTAFEDGPKDAPCSPPQNNVDKGRQSSIQLNHLPLRIGILLHAKESGLHAAEDIHASHA